MADYKVLKLNELTGNIEVFNLNTATPSAAGLMDSLDKERLDYLVEHASEKIKIGVVDDSIPEEIVTKLKFDLGKGFVVDLNTFNEAHISLDNFVQYISNGIDTLDVDSTNTLTISGGEGIDVQINSQEKMVLINSIDSNFTYESAIPSMLHIVDHNLNTNFIDSDIYVEDEDNPGQFSKDYCTVQLVSPNRAEIYLTESLNIIALFSKKA